MWWPGSGTWAAPCAWACTPRCWPRARWCGSCTGPRWWKNGTGTGTRSTTPTVTCWNRLACGAQGCRRMVVWWSLSSCPGKATPTWSRPRRIRSSSPGRTRCSTAWSPLLWSTRGPSAPCPRPVRRQAHDRPRRAHGPGARVTAASGGHPAPVPVLRDVEQHWPVLGRPQQAEGAFVVLRTDRVRMPDGEVARRDVVEHPGAVAVVALDDAGQVLLIRQYRHPAGHLLWEIPAGLRDVPGEPARATGERELREETGYAARTWHALTDCYTSPGISTERVIVFLARDLARVPDRERGLPLRHEEAQLQPAWVPLDRAVQLFLAGELH